ncbi:MAG: HNH endonuclease [Magnetococcales bacterium]|nr:HNH endonuclease [Magnetococcales bacterium]
MNLDDLFIPADPERMQRERLKAKELKRTAWWKSRLGQGVCHYCGVRCPPQTLTMDHVIPIIRGGQTTRQNCVPACLECNQAKRHLSSTQWQCLVEQKRAANTSSPQPSSGEGIQAPLDR